MTALAFAVTSVLVVLAGALRMGGASLVRTPRADALHDAADGNRGADVVAELLDERPRLQPALGMVNSALMVAAAIPAAWALAALLSGWWLLAGLIGLGILLVMAADLLPRSFGRARPRTLAYRLAKPLRVAVRLGSAAADLISDEDEDDDTEEDDEQDAEEKELISSVLEFTEAIVREVMVPRTDMSTIPASSDTDFALDVVLETGKSRVPVTGDDLDDIVGVLYARDLLRLFDSGEGPRAVTKLMRHVHFVPESKRVSDLLRELQQDQVHLAIVVDEFGSTAGLVTIEDLLEELVGEIVDEYDEEESLIEETDSGYLVDGRLPVDDLSELVGMDLPDDEWDTVGGLILSLAGRVPEQGEAFTLDGLEISAERVQGRRVSLVRITRT